MATYRIAEGVTVTVQRAGAPGVGHCRKEPPGSVLAGPRDNWGCHPPFLVVGEHGGFPFLQLSFACAEGVCFLGQTVAIRQSPVTRRDSREFSESGIRAVQGCDCPTAPCGGGHDTHVGHATSETRRGSGNCHARRRPKALLGHVADRRLCVPSVCV